MKDDLNPASAFMLLLNKINTIKTLQLSPTCESDELSNKERFPSFFRTSKSGIMANPAIIALMKEYNWQRIALVTETSSLHTEVVFFHFILLKADTL